MENSYFAKSVDPDEAAHNETPRQDLYCLSSRLLNLNIIQIARNIFGNLEILLMYIISSAFWSFES